MIRRSLTIGVLLVVSLNSQAQSGGKGSHAVLENAAKTIGADGLKSIKYSGNGFNFALGQSPRPFAPWPKFNVKSYTRTINYDTASSQEEMVRTQYENPFCEPSRFIYQPLEISISPSFLSETIRQRRGAYTSGQDSCRTSA